MLALQVKHETLLCALTTRSIETVGEQMVTKLERSCFHILHSE